MQQVQVATVTAVTASAGRSAACIISEIRARSYYLDEFISLVRSVSLASRNIIAPSMLPVIPYRLFGGFSYLAHGEFARS